MKRIYLGIAVIILMAVFIFVGGTMIANAYADKGEGRHKYYESILIESGDTLWSIAERYASDEYGSKDQYIQELMQINGLTSDGIQSGNYLTIVYYR